MINLKKPLLTLALISTVAFLSGCAVPPSAMESESGEAAGAAEAPESNNSGGGRGGGGGGGWSRN